MRKTATFDAEVLETADALADNQGYRVAAELISGRQVPTSESGRLDMLAAIGAATVRQQAAEQGYSDLAALLSSDPTPLATQVTKGRPPVGEDPADFAELFEALGS